MTKLQSLTLVRDAVQLTKGITQGVYYGGHGVHCSWGAIQQVAIDAGFSKDMAEAMMLDIAENDQKLKTRIIMATDDQACSKMTPEERREHILNCLNLAIEFEEAKSPQVPNSTEGLENALEPVKA